MSIFTLTQRVIWSFSSSSRGSVLEDMIISVTHTPLTTLVAEPSAAHLPVSLQYKALLNTSTSKLKVKLPLSMILLNCIFIGVTFVFVFIYNIYTS